MKKGWIHHQQMSWKNVKLSFDCNWTRERGRKRKLEVGEVDWVRGWGEGSERESLECLISNSLGVLINFVHLLDSLSLIAHSITWYGISLSLPTFPSLPCSFISFLFSLHVPGCEVKCKSLFVCYVCYVCSLSISLVTAHFIAFFISQCFLHSHSVSFRVCVNFICNFERKETQQGMLCDRYWIEFTISLF